MTHSSYFISSMCQFRITNLSSEFVIYIPCSLMKQSCSGHKAKPLTPRPKGRPVIVVSKGLLSALRTQSVAGRQLLQGPQE